MDPDLWESLPATTNAGESIHGQMQHIIGFRHTLINGLYAAYNFAAQMDTKTELGQ